MADHWTELERAGQKRAKPHRRGSQPGRAPLPGELDRLAEQGRRTRWGGPGCRVCKKCEANGKWQPAVRGSDFCVRHGAAAIVGKRERTPAAQARRVIARLERAGQVPAGLARHPAWQAVRARGLHGAVVARSMALAWRAMEMGNDAQAWTRALAEARQAGFTW